MAPVPHLAGADDGRQRHGTRLGAANIGVALVLRRVIGPGAYMWRRVVISPNESRNRLLAALPNADLDLLRPHTEIIDLDVHQVLEEPGDVVSHGYEGMTGFGVVLGNTVPPTTSWCNPPDPRCESPPPHCARSWVAAKVSLPPC